MKTVLVEDVQKRLPELLRLVAQGEELELVCQGRAMAKLVPAGTAAGRVDWCESWGQPAAKSAKVAGLVQSR